MKAQLNRALLTQKNFDSGSLGALESVVHQFTRPGRYQGQIRRNGTVTGSFTFVVSEQGRVQLDVDLADVPTPSGDAGCCCDEESERAVAPNGYVLFHASHGRGYSVRVGQVGDKDPEFDSEQLRDGDLFALCLLEPTRYAVIDRIGGGKGEIAVSFSEADAKRLKNLETSYIDVGPKGFEPPRLSAVSTQGIVFRVKGKSRVVIEKLDAAKTKAAPRKIDRSANKKKQR